MRSSFVNEAGRADPPGLIAFVAISRREVALLDRYI